MGACYDHLSYVDRLSMDEGRRAGRRCKCRELHRQLLESPRQGRQVRRPRSRSTDRRGLITDDIKDTLKDLRK